MNVITRVKKTPAGTFVSLHLTDTNRGTLIARCWPDTDGGWYLDVTGKGADVDAAHRDLKKRIRGEVRKLGANGDRKPSQDRRLALLTDFIA